MKVYKIASGMQDESKKGKGTAVTDEGDNDNMTGAEMDTNL